MIDISVIVPIFNTPPELLRAALEDLGKQELGRFSAEYVLVDDGSTDPGTLKVLEEHEIWPFHPMYRAENGGTARALDTGLDHARGRFVVAAGSDDRYHRTWLARRAEALDRAPEKVAFVYDNFTVKEEGGRTYPVTLQGFDRVLLLARCYVPGNSMYRASVYEGIPKSFAYEGYDEMGRRAEDYNLWLNIADRWEGLWLDCWPKRSWTYVRRKGSKSSLGAGSDFRRTLAERAAARWGIPTLCGSCGGSALCDTGVALAGSSPGGHRFRCATCAKKEAAA